MIPELEATPGQLAELKLLVPKIATMINEFQMITIASSLDAELASGYVVRDHLAALVHADKVSEDSLVDVVRGIRIPLLRPSREAAIDKNIAEQGYASQPVLASEDQPAFAYSIGLTGSVGFELLVVAGQSHELVLHVLNAYAEIAKRGENIELERDDVLELRSGKGCRTKCISIEPLVATENFITQTRGEVKRVYQVLVADKNNVFPRSAGYDLSFSQPYLPRPLN